MKQLILLLLLFSASCFAQTWSGVVATSRAIDWSTAGLPASFTGKGGSVVETPANPWTPPVRTKCGSTLAAGSTVAQIQTAYDACADGTYILLGAGTFTIDSRLNLYGHSGTLRGSGPMSTKLNFTGTGEIFMGATSGGGTGALINDAGNFTVGSTTLKISGVTGSTPAVGTIAFLNQCDTGWSGNPCTGSWVDNGGLFICGWDGATVPACQTDTGGATATNPRQQQQAVLITAVTNTGAGAYTLTISPGLYMRNWAFAQTPVLTWYDTTYYGLGVGIEAMTIQQLASSVSFGSTELVTNQISYASWVKGVRFVGSGSVTNISLNFGKSILLANNYFFPNPVLDAYYPTPIQTTGNSDALILNDIMTSGVSWEGLGKNSGNVYAYNYARDTFTAYDENIIFDHHAYASFDLFEGNQLSGILEDDTWGTHGLNTIFRNVLSCLDTPYVSPLNASRGIGVDNFQRFENVIGNAIGGGGCTTYQAATDPGAVFRIGTSDTLTASSLFRWGNVSTVTQVSDTPANSGIRFVSSEVPTSLGAPNVALSNSVPASNTLPNSFFTTFTAKASGVAGTGLSWRKVCTTWTSFPSTCAAYTYPAMPAAGPDVTGGAYVNGFAGDIPAKLAWANLPIDTSFQNSYTIASSAWSGGTETLTFSAAVLPDTTHLMGPFSLSGTAIDGEYLMTVSTSTTVAFALGSDPGSLATKAMKFPNVRQFDEAVFQADNGTSAPTCTLVASPAIIKSGTSSTLTFTPANTPTTCSIDNGVGTVDCAGATPSVSPLVVTTYTASVSNAGGSNTCSATVTIGGVKKTANTIHTANTVFQ